MGLDFNGGTFSGDVLEFTPGAPEYEFVRTKFAGVIGVSEIQAGSGKRGLEIPVVVYGGFDSRDDLADYIERVLNLDSQSGGALGANGTLQYSQRGSDSDGSDSWALSYNDCTFEGFELAKQPGMLLDVAGTLDGGWFCFGTLKFTQLTCQVGS